MTNEATEANEPTLKGHPYRAAVEAVFGARVRHEEPVFGARVRHEEPVWEAAANDYMKTQPDPSQELVTRLEAERDQARAAFESLAVQRNLAEQRYQVAWDYLKRLDNVIDVLLHHPIPEPPAILAPTRPSPDTPYRGPMYSA